MNVTNFPYRAPFRLDTLVNWIETNKPEAIGMNDQQYSWYSEQYARCCPRVISKIPVHFIDAPTV